MMKSSHKKFIIISVIVLLVGVIGSFNPLTNQVLTIIYAHKAGLDKGIYYRQIKAESYFRSFAKSRKGAIGTGQVMYSTAVYVDPTVKRWQLYLPWRNLAISSAYMQMLLNRFKGNYSLALAAYNWGETNVSEKLREQNITIETDKNYIDLFVNVRETHGYLTKILR